MGPDHSYHLAQPPANDEFKTADKVECIGFLLKAVCSALPLGQLEPLPVMAVQFYQITEEISSEGKNEMNCDSESGSLLLSRQKSSVRGPGLSIISGHFITALHTGPNCYKQSRPFLSHPGVECEGQFDRLLTCPGLSHYHLRGLLKGSKSHPLVCYPFLTLLYHERFYCSPYFSWWKIIHLFQVFFFLSLLEWFVHYHMDECAQFKLALMTAYILSIYTQCIHTSKHTHTNMNFSFSQ